MLRASSSLNKVVETPGKRGPRLGQITRRPAKRGHLGSQENITETDFLVGFWPFCFWGPDETGRKKSKTRSDAVVDVLLWLEGQSNLFRDLLSLAHISLEKQCPHSDNSPPSEEFSQFCQIWMYLRFWSHCLNLHTCISHVCPVVGSIYFIRCPCSSCDACYWLLMCTQCCCACVCVSICLWNPNLRVALLTGYLIALIPWPKILSSTCLKFLTSLFFFAWNS